jgi:hypothetical protein
MAIKNKKTIDLNLRFPQSQDIATSTRDIIDSVLAISGSFNAATVHSGSDPGVAGQLFTTCSNGNNNYEILAVSKG